MAKESEHYSCFRCILSGQTYCLTIETEFLYADSAIIEAVISERDLGRRGDAGLVVDSVQHGFLLNSLS